MGNCFCQSSITIKRNHKSDISKELRHDRRVSEYEKKILILGPKRSGKSTIFNQLKYIHGNGFNDLERRQSKLDTVSFIIQSIQNVIECIEEYEKYKQFTIHQFTLNEEAKQSAEYIKDLDPNHNILDDIISNHINIISEQKPIQRIIDNADKYYIDISIRYFLKHFDRISKPKYIPSDQDIIQLRIKTDALNEEHITMRNNQFAVYDIDYKPDICNVNKYMHCFENVTAIIFVASLCCFDQPIFEDNKTYQQRMEWKQSMDFMESMVGNDILNVILLFIGFPRNAFQESLDLFDSLCNNIWFRNTAILLFLSKSDLFANKLNKYKHDTFDNQDINPFTECFNDFNGEISYDQCSEWIKYQFEAKNDNKDRAIFTHFVNGTDITLMTKIFNDVQQIIIENSLLSAGLMCDYNRNSH